MNVHICHFGDFKQLTQRWPSIRFLRETFLAPSDAMQFKIETKQAYDIQVLFMGKTGYGKSTTLNRLIGQKCFHTDPVESCTKELQSAEYLIEDNAYLRYYKQPVYFSFNDAPGIGESAQADLNYLEWYQVMLDKSACAVYVLRADQRDYVVDLDIFRRLFARPRQFNKIILAVNYADRVEPVSNSNSLSREQHANLALKCRSISQIFQVPLDRIVAYSAHTEFHLSELMEKISLRVLENTC